MHKRNKGIFKIHSSNKVIWILKQVATTLIVNKRIKHPKVTYEHRVEEKQVGRGNDSKKVEQAGIAFDPVASDDISYLVSLFVSYLVTMPMCS